MSTGYNSYVIGLVIIMIGVLMYYDKVTFEQAIPFLTALLGALGIMIRAGIKKDSGG